MAAGRALGLALVAALASAAGVWENDPDLTVDIDGLEEQVDELADEPALERDEETAQKVNQKHEGFQTVVITSGSRAGTEKKQKQKVKQKGE